MPWSAATTGFSLASIAAMTSSVVGARTGLPNSLMSAPAMKVRPAQTMTIAFTLASARARDSASTRALRIAWLSALTGGLSIVMTATSPSLRRLTSSDNSVLPNDFSSGGQPSGSARKMRSLREVAQGDTK